MISLFIIHQIYSNLPFLHWMAIRGIAKSTVYLPINSVEISSDSFVACRDDIESYYTLVLTGSHREHPVKAHAAFCSAPEDP